jgi:hypothetical protein
LRVTSLHVITAGLPDRLMNELRCGRREVERATSPDEALHLLRRSKGVRILVLSELFPGAGDLLAAVEADDILLDIRTVVAVVGGQTALAVALRHGGVPVVSRRGAGKRLNRLLRRRRLNRGERFAPDDVPARDAD